jgi:hypothetical protein
VNVPVLDFKTCCESTRRNIAPSCHTPYDQTTGRPDDQTTHNEIIYIEEGNINFLKTVSE